MATVADIDADLTLELDGIGITPERFQKGVRAFFGILAEVTRSVCDDKTNVQWRVQVKAGSNLVGVVPIPGFRPDLVRQIAKVVQDGVEALEHEGVQPQHFNETAMRHARELGEIIDGPDSEAVLVRLWAGKEPIIISHRTASSVLNLMAGEFEDHGSIDGRLQTISERGAMRFVIYDTLTDKAIPCYIDVDRLGDAIGSFRKRVEVYGLIRYRKDGAPTSIGVESIVPFPPAEEIPSFRSVRGILRKRT